MGPAFPQIDAEPVLERFRRLDKSRAEGAGLGLAIASTIMQLHGGRIEIDDAPGGGALVRLVFANESGWQFAPRDPEGASKI